MSTQRELTVDMTVAMGEAAKRFQEARESALEAALANFPTLDAALAEAAGWHSELAADGPDMRPMAHLKVGKEGAEFAENPTLDEAADILICLVAAALHRGWSNADLALAVRTKLAINRKRTWKQERDGTWQHVKDAA